MLIHIHCSIEPTANSIEDFARLFAVACKREVGRPIAHLFSFIIKRKADGKYFNVATGAWQDAIILNEAFDDTGSTWTIDIAGEARRAFAGTIVTLEARVTVGSTVYVNATIPELTIR